VSVKAFKFCSLKIVETFTEAIQTVDAKQAGGKYGQLWIDFAKFYENNEQLDDARYIFDKATKATFKSVDELATLWCEWAEMELRHE
jgi:pre-mRNA-splicing factor SYF1